MSMYLNPLNSNFMARRKSHHDAVSSKNTNIQKKEDTTKSTNTRDKLVARRQSMPHIQQLGTGQALLKISVSVKDICTGLPVDPLPQAQPTRSKGVAHAPNRNVRLSPEEEMGVVQDALTYFPPMTHEILEGEFFEELRNYGHIYMYRFRPTLKMRAYPLCHYPVVTCKAAAAMQMIMGNLDSRVAKYPHELITYDGKSHVFSNWAQFWIAMHYLSTMTEEQTLVIYSGHPTGLFPSSPTAPRVVVTNGITKLPRSPCAIDGEMFAIGVGMFGHIGPQAYVHATMLTMISASRKYARTDDLSGKVFLSSGLGLMGASQALASLMNGCVGIIAEVNQELIEKWKKEEWLTEVSSDVEEIVEKARKGREEKKAMTIGYHGNVIDLWERFAEELEQTGECLVDFGTDQTDLTNPFHGGYIPAQLTLDDARAFMKEKPDKFKKYIHKSLRHHVKAINTLAAAGMVFWDYGNSFQYEASRAGADIVKPDAPFGVFKYPTYGMDILGDLFAVGFAPFRWTFTSGSPNDLGEMDKEVVRILEEIAQANLEELPPITPTSIHDHYQDSIKWMKQVQKYRWNYGSLSRMLYTDQRGRVKIALAFNKAIKNDVIKGPVILSRDYHDTSVIGNAYKTAPDILDSSPFMSDLAIQDCIGDSFRGATWISMNNSGRSGLGQILDGGFGLVIDGSEEAEKKAKLTLTWDVANGVAQRAWRGNTYARSTIRRAMKDNHSLQVTLPHMKLDHQRGYAKAFQGLKK
eukprot:gene11144-12316_t